MLQRRFTCSGSLCEKNRLFPVSNAAISSSASQHIKGDVVQVLKSVVI
ncbi:MAG: hypothetical protein QW141_07095 [Ignisphaera sp.]